MIMHEGAKCFVLIVEKKKSDMITNLTISYSVDNINIMLSTDTKGENLPYNLADIFEKVINDSNANEEIVIEQLKNELGL